MFRARWRTFIRPPLIPPLVVMGSAALISLAAAQLAVAAPLFATSVAVDCSTSGVAARALARHAGACPHWWLSASTPPARTRVEPSAFPRVPKRALTAG